MNSLKKFHLDRMNGKFMGVCAGIADYLKVDVTFVRVAAVVVTLLGAAPWSFVAYAAAAWLAKPKPLFEDDETPRLRTSTREARESMRDIDRRMAEVESYVSTSNSRLAREIEELR